MESVPEKLEPKKKRGRPRKNGKDPMQASQCSPQLEENVVKQTPVTTDDHTYCQSPQLNESPNKRMASQQFRNCKVVVEKLCEDKIRQYQTSSTVDKEINENSNKCDKETNKTLEKPESLGNSVCYKGSSTRGYFLDMDENDSWSPLSFTFNDDSLDKDYLPYDLVFSNKKSRYEDDEEWTPTLEGVHSVKRKKVPKTCSADDTKKRMKCDNEDPYATESSNSVENVLKSGTDSAENQNINLRASTKLRQPHLNDERNKAQPFIKPVSEYPEGYVKPMAKHSSSNPKTKIPFGKGNHGTFRFESEVTFEFLPERTSPNPVENVIRCGRSSTEQSDDEDMLKGNCPHMGAETHSGCLYCKCFIEIDAIAILAVASLDEDPKGFVEEGIEYAEKVYGKVKSARLRGYELNLELVQNKMEGLKCAKDLLLRFGSFVNVSDYLMKPETLLEKRNKRLASQRWYM